MINNMHIYLFHYLEKRLVFQACAKKAHPKNPYTAFVQPEKRQAQMNGLNRSPL